MPEHWRDKKPIEGLPAGLISWFSPGDKPVVLVTFWVALIGGDLPRVRASWPGRRDPRSLFWPGGDFVLHFLTDENLAEVGRLSGSGRLCFDAEADLGLVAGPSAAVRAPLFRQFPMQLECCGGKIDADAHDPEIAGEVFRIHCGTNVIDGAAVMDLHALNLFRCFSSSGSP